MSGEAAAEPLGKRFAFGKKSGAVGIPFVKGAEGEAVQAAYAAYVASQDACNPEDSIRALEAVFRAHPFVKSAAARKITTATHSFLITGYSLNINAFRKWLKTAPPDVRKTAGGMSDDGLYALSSLLRHLMPRGFHVIQATCTATGVQSLLAFTGIFKFTGLNPGDEDEESACTDDASKFFAGGAALTDATGFWETVKSNGENAKFRVVQLDGTLFLIAGSKNTCTIWPAHERPVIGKGKDMDAAPASAAGEVDGDELLEAEAVEPPVHVIAAMISDWFLALADDKRAAFVADALTLGTFMGEVNRPDSEHIVPIDAPFIEFYTVLDAETGWSLQQAAVLAIFEKHGLPHVPMSHHDISELPSIISAIRGDATREGAVLYLQTADQHVVGLVKVKSSHYVIVRRLRENFRSQVMRPCREALRASNPITDELLDQVRFKAMKKLELGMKTLTHVPGCEERWPQWFETCFAYVQWWIARVKAGEPFAKLTAEFERKFASTYARFLAETGRVPFSG